MPSKPNVRIDVASIALGCVVSAAIWGASCVSHASPPSDRPGSPDQQQSGRASPTPGLISALKKFPVSDFDTVEEAAAVAGYAIPKPSEFYPLANRKTHLQGSPVTSTPLSLSLYRFPPKADESFEVDVGIAAIWSGDGTWTRGTEITVGGKDGWLHTNDGGIYFAYRCGSAQEQTLWCVVLGSESVGRDNFLAFVETLN